jgi:outer membrane protein TolC
MYRPVLSVLLLLLGSAVFAQTSEIISMSLSDAKNYALEHNQTLLNAGLDVEAADAFVKENIATGLPQINGGLDLSSNFSLPPSFIPAEFVGGPAGETAIIYFGTDYSGQANATLSQMVFDGVFFVGLEAARTFKELSSKEHIQSKIDIIEAVNKAYYGVLVNDLTLDLIENNYHRLDTLLMETRIMYDNGFAEKIDVTRVLIQYNNIRVERDNARRLREVSLALLKFQMGMPVSQPLELTDELSAEIFSEEPDRIDFEPVTRIEYSILQTRRQLAELDLKRTRVEYLPKLDLYATLGASAGVGSAANIFNVTNEWFTYGFAGLKLNLPIFDGLTKHRVAQQKKVKIEQVNNTFEQLTNSINLEVNETAIRLQNSLDKMYVQRENMDLSEEVYNVTKTKYQQGVGSNIEVINADADYKQAQLNFFTALYEALIAKVKHEKALGQLL